MDCLDNSYCDLGLDGKGFRISSCDVIYLMSEKFEQIKLFLIPGRSAKPQVDVLFINEAFPKLDVPDSLFHIPEFVIYRWDRKYKFGGRVLVFVHDDLTVKRGGDLEKQDLEVIWLEVLPFKSKRSLLLAGIYHSPSHSK